MKSGGIVAFLAALALVASSAAADLTLSPFGVEPVGAAAIDVTGAAIPLGTADFSDDWQSRLDLRPAIKVEVEWDGVSGQIIRVKAGPEGTPADKAASETPKSPADPKTEPIPEPATLALLAFGGLIIVFSRRRRA